MTKTKLPPEETAEVEVLDIDTLMAEVHKEMGIKVFQAETKYYLKTWEHLDRTIGTPDGLPYGKMIELSGVESHGKSLIKTLIMGCGQRDGAVVISDDIENSNDPVFNKKMGIDNDSLILIQPKMVWKPLGKKSKEENVAAKAEWKKRSAVWRNKHPFVPLHISSDKRYQTAEELFDETEILIKKLHRRGVEKFVLGVDSIANLSTEAQLEAGVHQNMRTNADLSMFLSGNLKRWAQMCQNYSVLAIFVNQIRERPGFNFGDPTYEPGGRALRHNCASRNRVRRKKDGRITQSGKGVIGINGIIRNTKNKMGEGSVEQRQCEYRITWTDKPLKERVKFMPVTKTVEAKETDTEE